MNHDRDREAAIALANKGEIASPIEIARLADVSRQLARFWLRDVDIEGRRQTHLQKLWRQHLRGKP
jgi:hypothetical protein